MTKKSDFYKEILKAISCNNINEVKLLLVDNRVDTFIRNNYVIRYASENGNTDIVKLLLNDKRVDPSNGNNYAIRWAFESNHTNVVNLLWKNKKVKSTLQKDNLDLYNELIQQDLQNKVFYF